MNALVTIPAVVKPPAPTRFDNVSIGLHWATVVLVAALFASAWSLGLAGDRAAGLLTLHRSLGETLWLVAICRLGWRLRFAVRPPLPASLPPLQHRAATIAEGGLYALLLLQPLSGLAQSLARGRPFQLFVFQAPKLMARDKPLATLFHQIHGLTAWLLLGLIAVHAGAALFHHLVLRDGVLRSMLPWAGPDESSRRGNKPARPPV
jgi:cytochrome b561